jgi:hypothetical protein
MKALPTELVVKSLRIGEPWFGMANLLGIADYAVEIKADVL